MHEMGIADAMIKTLDGVLKGQTVLVRSVTVELGDLSGVVPRFLQNCWEAVAAGTRYEGARLLLHPVPATARCEDCKTVFVADLEALRCPRCGSDKLTPLSGTELTIAEVEVEEPEEPEEPEA